MDTLRGVATDTGLTVITTLHQVDAARRYADRILGFCEGQLIFDGPPPDLGPEALHRIFGRATPDRPEPSGRGGDRRAPVGAVVMSTLGAVLRGPAPTAPPHVTRTGRSLAVLLLLAVALALAARVVELRPFELLRDAGNIATFLRGYLRPSFAHIGEYAWQCVVTLCIALWGTALAVILSVPLGLLGARNCSPHPIVYHAARRTMDVLRAVNEFVFALMFVTAVGLGPFAGTLALGILDAARPGFVRPGSRPRLSGVDEPTEYPAL